VIEAHFGESEPFSLGVEEELMILDAETFAPVPAVKALIAASEGLDLPGRLKTELHASIVELNTDICPTAGEALEALRELRTVTATLAERHGLRVAAAGSHPFARPEELEIVTEPRYQEFVDYAGITARRQGVSGLHVHVGMPDPDACMVALEGVLPWLPVVLALSANSPYLAGAEAGMLSARAEVLSLLPRRGAPPAFGGYADWERFVERMVASGLVRDYTAIWWDVRPHPRFGTVEIRMPDQPTSLALTGAFVALLQALCAATTAERPLRSPDAIGRGIYDQNRWAAARFGPHGKLIHPDREESIAAGELADELIGLVRPAAHELHSGDLLAALDPSRCEADRQLEIGTRDGLEAVCADLVRRSLASG
jgi:carboxylate-amine ligase